MRINPSKRSVFVTNFRISRDYLVFTTITQYACDKIVFDEKKGAMHFTLFQLISSNRNVVK